MFLLSVVIIVQFFLTIYIIIKTKYYNKIYDYLNYNKIFSPKEVSNFYDKTTPFFLKTYGDVFQSFRTKDVKDYLYYTAKSAKLEDGQLIFDAGCGVGGPAIFFANKLNLKVHGCTISEVQNSIAQKSIRENSLEDKVQILCYDFHKLSEKFNLNHYDRVLFLESLGHSNDIYSALKSAYEILKPGGILYVKDLFKSEPIESSDEKILTKFINDVNKRYKFNMCDLYNVIKIARKLGYIIINIKTPEISPDDFENFIAAGKLQTDFDVIDMEDYTNFIQPADYLELVFMKPTYNTLNNKDIYYINKLE